MKGNIYMMNLILLVLSYFLVPLQGTQIKQLSKNCLCDVSTDCDYQCCCDSDCTMYWSKCTSNLGIPLCSSYGQSDRDIDILDMNSGLHMVFTVIKRLFCIESVNFIDLISFYNDTLTDSQIQVLSQRSREMYMVQSFQQAKIQFDFSVYLVNAIGICENVNYLIELQSSSIQQCLAKNQLDVSKFGQIKCYSIQDATSISANNTTCNNNIKYLHLQIYPDNKTLNTQYSYAIVGNNPSFEKGKVIYDYVYTQNGIYTSRKEGYAIGDRLVLLNKSNGKYYRIYNPINLAYKNINGNCVNSSIDVSSIISFRLGYSARHTCNGNNNAKIWDNIKNAFSHIGIIAASGQSLADYTPIVLNDVGSGTGAKFTITYTKIGSQDNTQYQIINAKLERSGSVNGQTMLVVDFQEISTSPSLYVPSPPTVEAYLPDDFLYPFYVV